jgi:hypothetical protein
MVERVLEVHMRNAAVQLAVEMNRASARPKVASAAVAASAMEIDSCARLPVLLAASLHPFRI